MTAAFPASLPGPLLEGYQAETEPGVTFSVMDAANARARRAHPNAPLTVTATWRLTLEQRKTLSRFLAARGTEPFFVPLRVPGDPRGLRAEAARLVSEVRIGLIAPNEDDVRMTLRVDAPAIILSFGALLAPDGSAVAAPDGGAVEWEEHA